MVFRKKGKSPVTPAQSSDPRVEVAVRLTNNLLGFEDRITDHATEVEALATRLSAEQLDRLSSPQVITYRNYMAARAAEITAAAATSREGYFSSPHSSREKIMSRLDELEAAHRATLEASLHAYEAVADGTLDPVELIRSIREAQERAEPDHGSIS